MLRDESSPAPIEAAGQLRNTSTVNENLVEKPAKKFDNPRKLDCNIVYPLCIWGDEGGSCP